MPDVLTGRAQRGMAQGDMAQGTANSGTAAAQRWRDLMVAAQDGDGPAYAALLRECVPLIRSQARHRGVPADRADDVVQDVLLTIHRVRHTYDPGRPFTPWLRAIVQRRAIDALRRSGRQGARELHAPLAYDGYADPAAAADQRLADAGQAARLNAAVATLPPGQRQALEQLGLQERSLAEASLATGRSVGALKVTLHRALNALRATLGKESRE